jgi:hypothetical protein
VEGVKVAQDVDSDDEVADEDIAEEEVPKEDLAKKNVEDILDWGTPPSARGKSESCTEGQN